MDFVDGDFESVNQENFANTYVNDSDVDDLDVILGNIRFIKHLVAHTKRMEYFVPNNAENIIDIFNKA